MSDKQQISLFKISKINVQTIALQNGSKEESLNTNAKLIKYMMNSVKGRKPTLLALSSECRESYHPFNVELYFHIVPIDFTWRDFFLMHLEEENEVNDKFVNNDKTKHASFICFIYDDDEIYSFTGGLGNNCIKNFVDDDFGIRMLEKIGDPETLLLRKASDNSIVGNVAQDVRYYRGDQKTGDEDSIGKIVNEAVGEAPFSELFTEVKDLLFKDDSDEKISVKARASLSFSRSLSFLELKRIITFIKLMPEDPNFKFSSIQPLSRRHHDIIKSDYLDSLMHEKIINFFRMKRVEASFTDPDFLEIAHSDYESFYGAGRLQILRGGNPDVCLIESPYGLLTNDVLSMIYVNDSRYILGKLKEVDKTSSQAKKKLYTSTLAKKYTVRCFGDEREPDIRVLNKNLLEYISCEMRDENGDPFFRVSGKWYKSSENFAEDLDEEFKSVYGDCVLSYPIPLMWGTSGSDKETENTYLHHVVNNLPNNALVMHKVIPQQYNLELCDIMFWDEENLYLIHVKPSFDGAVRVLEKQIAHSARLIGEDLRTSTSVNGPIAEYYRLAASYDGDSVYLRDVAEATSEIDEDTFIRLFKQKRIQYVACIVDPKAKRSLEDIESFNSTIAKMSIIESYKSIRKNASPGSRFRITEIDIDENYNES